MTRIHLATGLALQGDRILLVASSYPSQPTPLWNLPGGRQEAGELLVDTVQREVREETGLDAHVRELAYVTESYDGEMQFTNATFSIDVSGTMRLRPERDHVVDVAWVPIDEVARFVTVAVVRDPLLAHLNGNLHSRYAGFYEAGIHIAWDD